MRVVPREYPVPECRKMFRDFLCYMEIPEHQCTMKKEREKMDFLTGMKEKEVLELESLLTDGKAGQEVKVNGAVMNIRNMGDIAFIILRKRDGVLQAVFEKGVTEADFSEIREETFVEAAGIVKTEERAPHGIELRLKSIKILSKPAEPMPIAVSKWKMGASLEARLDMRPLTLRNIRERARFKIEEGIARAFREFLQGQGFTEIHSPKIGARGAEGGANVFKLDYFHRPAVLAQSPQFYKQMMVGVFDRVMEIGPVFRAEKHNTKRHLNEYTGLDFEMGYIDDVTDIMAMETGFLQYMVELLRTQYSQELEILSVKLPKTDKIPCVTFTQAKELASEKYGVQIRNPYDLEPEEEHLIGRYFKDEYNADFVFVTQYPSKKRPFYAMDDPEDIRFTKSFDLLFRGLEVTTGGQRIHDYRELMAKIEKRGMDVEGMDGYLDTFKYGMPPHGGLGIGLERMTMQLLEEENVREVSLFPRDMSRLVP